MNDSPVLIAGAGPTGLALALWLTRLGVRVRIIDRSTGPGLTSRALAVQVRTLEFYRQLGFADLVIDGGVEIAGLNFWVQGARAARLPLRQIGEGLSPYPFALVYPQDAHERLLIAQLEKLGVAVERRTELIRMSQDAAGVSVTVRSPDGAEENGRVAYLAGCDGASSTVREQLGIGFPGGTYSGLFYVADADAAGPAIDRELHVDLEDADFVLLFPMKEQGRVRLVGLVREQEKAGSGELSFDDVRGKAIEHLRLTIGKVHWFSTYRVHHRVADSFRQGRVFLLGDAAHIHSPVGGQGMNTGIGDAVNLAWKLAAVLEEKRRAESAGQLRAGTDRLCPAARGHDRPGIHHGHPAGCHRPFRAHPAGSLAGTSAGPLASVSAFPVPHRFPDRGELPRKRIERRLGRLDPGRRPPALGPDPGGRGQLRAAGVDRLAGPPVRRGSRRTGRGLCRSRAAAARLPLDTGDGDEPDSSAEHST